MACRLEEIPEIGDYTEYTPSSTIGDRHPHQGRREGLQERLPPPRRAAGERPGTTAASGLRLPVPRLALECARARTLSCSAAASSMKKCSAAPRSISSRCRIEFWAGCAFINFDDDAPACATSLGPVADRMDARHVDKLKMDWWYGTVLPTNWKLAMEAFQEGFHTPKTHPQLHAVSVNAIAKLRLHKVLIITIHVNRSLLLTPIHDQAQRHSRLANH